MYLHKNFPDTAANTIELAREASIAFCMETRRPYDEIGICIHYNVLRFLLQP